MKAGGKVFVIISISSITGTNFSRHPGGLNFWGSGSHHPQLGGGGDLLAGYFLQIHCYIVFVVAVVVVVVGWFVKYYHQAKGATAFGRI